MAPLWVRPRGSGGGRPPAASAYHLCTLGGRSAKYVDFNTDYTGQGVDQLARAINTIKTNPTDRRIIMSAWNPAGPPRRRCCAPGTSLTLRVVVFPLRSRFGPDGAPTVPHVLPVLRCQRRAVMPGTSAHARVCGLWSCACAHDVLRWLWCVCRCTNGLPTWGLGSRSTSQATRSLLAWLRKCVV